MSYCSHSNIAGIRAVYFNPIKTKDTYQVEIIQTRYFTDLHSVIFGKSLPINKKSICEQILKALKYIHEAGLVHLDLKPSNIMFKSKSLTDIVLLDFGISDLCRENQGAKIMGMTPNYCPPEIKFYDLSKISPAADIFSFGIIFYELITLRSAWAQNPRQDPNAIYNLIRNPNFSFFQTNSSTQIDKIDELIRNCTSINAVQRPSAVELLERIKILKF